MHGSFAQEPLVKHRDVLPAFLQSAEFAKGKHASNLVEKQAEVRKSTQEVG